MASDFIIDDRGNAPFDYSIRVSRKARYAKLQIKPYLGLEIVIPTRFPKKAVPDLLREHADWILRQLDKHNHRFKTPTLPQEVTLSINKSVVSIISSDDFEIDLTQLRRLVRREAWKLLPPMLEVLSRECGLAYKKISIRSQKTRWGSCSSRGTISLNDQLVFVPEDTARYLMIHELCHTRHMNHSVKFWQLVESFCADFRGHERILNQARNDIPEWLLYSLYR